MILYIFSIDLGTFKVEASKKKYKDYDKECLEYASVEECSEGSSVYAESALSAAEARRLVYEKCISVSKLYAKAGKVIEKGKNEQAAEEVGKKKV